MAKQDLNIKIGADIRNLERSLGKVERSMQRTARKLQSIGSDLTQSVSIPILGIGGAAIQAAGDFEKLENGLKAILGPTGDYRAELDRLRKVAEAPGLGFEQAVRGSIRLQAVGFSADEARESLSAFGKAVALTGGTAQELDSVVRQLAQINSKGRLLAEDINVILENAPGVALALNEAFGTASVEAIRETGISAKEFTDRLTAAIQASETFAGVQGGLGNAIENARIALRFFLADIGKQINELFDVQGIVERLSDRLVGLADQFRALDDDTKKTIIRVAAFAAALGPALLAVGKFANILSLVPGQLKTLVSFINPVTLGLTVLAAFLIDAYQNSEDFRNAVADLLTELRKLPNSVAKIIDKFRGLNGDLKETTNILQNIRDFFAEITQALADFLGGFNDLASGNIGDGFKRLFAGILDATSIGVLAESLGFDIGDRLTQGIRKRVTGSESALLEGGFLAGIVQPGGGGLPIGVRAPAASTTTTTRTTTPTAPGGDTPAEEIAATPRGFIGFQKSISDIEKLNERIIQSRQENINWAGTLAQVNEQFGAQRAQLEALPEATENAAVTTRSFLENFQGLSELAGTLQSGFEGFFQTLASGGKNALQAFTDIVKRLAIQLAAALATAIALATVFSLLGLGTFGSSFTGLLFGKGGSGGFLRGIIPGFAEGGIVPSGYPNDTYLARLSSGEAVIPLNKLNQFTGGEQVLTARISGSDLLILLDRARKENNRLA